jgi:putative ABC transport system substrate-binding protein
MRPARDVRRREFVIFVGAALTAPRYGRAQQKAMPVIGLLNPGSPGPAEPFLASLRQGLAETGYVEGRNVAIEYRWAEGHYDRLPALAAELVARKVDVIAAVGGSPAAAAAKNATTTIPIVFGLGVDPVATGLVASLARPGGNLTGITVLARELIPKQIDIISELVPQGRVIGILYNPTLPTASLRDGIPRDMQQVADARGLQLQRFPASAEGEIDAAFAALRGLGVDALIVAADPFFALRRGQIVTLAIQHMVPTVFDNRGFVDAGGLISYGTITTGRLRPVGVYIGKILAGANPADLPVQQSVSLELVINKVTAKAIGLAIPTALLARADEVIE